MMEAAMATQSLVIKKLIISENDFISLKEKIISMRYDVDDGEGFYIVQEDNKFLNAYYIYDVISSFNVYDADINEFKKIQNKQQEYVSFFMDFEYKTIDIFGNKNKCAKVINILGRISNYKIRIDDIVLEYSKILKTLVADNIIYKVNKLKIKDYPFFDNVIGDCTLNIENYNNIEWLFDKYRENITQFSVTIGFEQPTVFMFYKSGAISIYKDVKDIEIDNIRLIKKCIV